MCETEERWLPVRGFDEFYEVSDLGRVRSFDRYTRNGQGLRLLRGRILKPGLTSSGRLTVSLSGRDTRHKTHLVHQLVLEAFRYPRTSERSLGCHGPGGPLDNRLVNLRWGSPVEDAIDRMRNATGNWTEEQWLAADYQNLALNGEPLQVGNRGENCAAAKLTAEIVMEIRRRFATGETQTALLEEFSVTSSTLCNAIQGKTWAWLPGAVPIDRKRHGKQGEAHHAAKLTSEIVRECRDRSARGEYQRDLAREFGVSQASMQKAISGGTWRNV